ncbi:MAG: hypothetical protein IKV16_06725 [Clostridia bacterium]|nr:hypothetical protein [Clostridia bacterium]
MGRKKINEAFFAGYIELDRDCCDKFGVSAGGVTEYINRLNNARFAPGRDDVLPRLVRYRNIRNKFAHEMDSMRKADEITKVDVKWIRSFDKDVINKKDPISLYLRKARKYVRRHRLRRWAYCILFATIVALAAALYFALNK